jgi:hypothetical protein
MKLGCHGRLGCDLHNLASREFRWGFVLGLLAVGLTAAVAGMAGHRRLRLGSSTNRVGDPPLGRVIGLPFAVAVLVGLAVTHRLPFELAIGVGLLALGGRFSVRRRYPIWALSLVPGSATVAFATSLPVPIWTRLVVAIAPPLLAPVLNDVDRRADLPAITPLLVAVSVVGLYEAVPDPEQALVLLGASLPLIVMSWPAPLSGLGSEGSATTVGILTWMAAIGGRGRLSAFVGGIACFGLLVGEPMARWCEQHLWARLSQPSSRRLREIWWTRPALAAVHLLPVYMASRVVGPLGSPPPVPDPPANRIVPAALLAAVVVALATILALAVRRASWLWSST